MNKVEAIIRPEKLEAVKEALAGAGFVGPRSSSTDTEFAVVVAVHAGRRGLPHVQPAGRLPR